MKRKVYRQILAITLASAMAFGSPMAAFAEETTVNSSEVQTEESSTEVTGISETETETEVIDKTEETSENASLENNENEEDTIASDEESEEETIIPAADESDEEETEKETSISDYNSFLTQIKVLYGYAQEYAADHAKENVDALIINYIRTGVKKYTSDSWQIIAGAEKTEFVSYVEKRDDEEGTSASTLRNIESFTLPNGNHVDFAHMFGTMDITSYCRMSGATEEVSLARADMGGWAGDVCDLISMTNELNVSASDIEALSTLIRTDYLGEDAYEGKTSHTFSQKDLYGDLDAFYIMNELKSSGNSLIEVLESYFSGNPSDQSRAEYFLKNRMQSACRKADIRKLVTNSYVENTLITALEANYGVSGLTDLRTACCNAFADYLFNLAGDDNGPAIDEETDDPAEDEKPENGYYTVFSSATSTLAPGVQQDIKYALTADNKQIVYYTATVDVSRSDVSMYANYHNNDGSTWAMSRVSDQMAAAQAKHTNPDDPEHYIDNYNVIVGTNADFYNMSTGCPSGCLVMEGVEYKGSSENFFAILKDGTPMIGHGSQYKTYKDQIQEAVGASIFLIENGEIVVKPSSNYYNQRASRTAVGITTEGKVIMMVLDGRQEPFSAGGSAEEIAQIMLEAGCVTAVNLDGGGSTTFAAKQEGSDAVSVVNRPSDGYERSVSSSLLVVSTAKTSKKFDHAIINSDTDYLTIGSSLPITATGVSESGNSADVPENATWNVVNSSIGKIDNNVFIASAKGSTEIQLLVDGTVVGTKTLNVVMPDELQFTGKSMDAIYGETSKLPVQAFYNGNLVTVQASDITFELSNPLAGNISGFDFVGNEASGIKNVKVTAMLTRDYSVSATMTVVLYSKNEAKFDFDTAMYGDRHLAWNREVSNSDLESIIEDDIRYDTYTTKDGSKAMDTSYTFALDMTKAPIPEQLLPLLSMVAGGDLDNVTAWDLLLQLAERVSAKTNCEVTLKYDSNMVADITNLTVVNDYFTIDTATINEEKSEITVKFNWVKQSEAIPSEIANPIVILSGIKFSPKTDAEWNNNTLKVVNSGAIKYDIYLGASALYSMSNQSSFQEQYGIYPYIEPENTTHPSGGHFAAEFARFNDTYTLDCTIKNGWVEKAGNLYYYQDNSPVSGIQKIPEYKHPENEIYYSFDADGVCAGKVNGLFDVDGDKYYAVQGILQNSWRMVTNANGVDEYYYFDRQTYKAVDGSQKIGGYDYRFENNVLVEGCWVVKDDGTQYVWAGKMKQNEWFTVDGHQYFAYANTCYVATGIAKTLNHERTGEEVYAFDETGIWQEDVNGFYDYKGETYLVNDGVRVAYPGLVLIDGSYYYFKSSHTMVKGKDYYVSKTNNLMPAGTYTFAADGKMVMAEEKLNGIVKESDTTWYYYKDGVKFYAGLIQIDGDYYYVNSSFQVIHDRSYFISKTNGLMPNATYNFGADGKMIMPGQGLNGIVKESDTTWYYYVDGVKTYAGLIEIDGDYYYVNSSFQVIHGRSYYTSKTNGLLPAGTYEFDADGKMVVEAEKKNGIVKESDTTWYYYIDGVKTYAGLIEIDGDYYYVNSSFQVIHGRSYFISKSNGLMPNATYQFDDDGKMIQ